MRASKWWIKISLSTTLATYTSRALNTQPNGYHCSLLGNYGQMHGLRIWGNEVRMRSSHTDLSWETKSSAEPGIRTETIAPPEPAVRLQGASGNGRPGKTDHRQMQSCTESEQILREGCKASDEAEGQQTEHNRHKRTKKRHWSEEFILKTKFKETKDIMITQLTMRYDSWYSFHDIIFFYKMRFKTNYENVSFYHFSDKILHICLI